MRSKAARVAERGERRHNAGGRMAPNETGSITGAEPECLGSIGPFPVAWKRSDWYASDWMISVGGLSP
jgi:hypothetical protein